MGAENFFKKAGEEPNVESIPTISDEMKDTLKDKITGIDSRSLRDKSEPQINPEFVQWERNKDILRAIEIVNRSISHYDYINENPNNYNTESVGQPSMFAPHKQIMLATEWKYNSLIELEQLGKEINKKFANNIE